MHEKNKVHHHRKGEMEHHKIRESHKEAHHAKHHDKNHDKHNSMHDNRHVSDNHQQGIERVKQRHGDMQVGQHGKMGMHHHKDSFKPYNSKMTPVKG